LHYLLLSNTLTILHLSVGILNGSAVSSLSLFAQSLSVSLSHTHTHTHTHSYIHTVVPKLSHVFTLL